MSELEAASQRWSGEFGCEVTFQDRNGHVHANVGDIYVGTWNSLTDAETGIARLWMIQ